MSKNQREGSIEEILEGIISELYGEPQPFPDNIETKSSGEKVLGIIAPRKVLAYDSNGNLKELCKINPLFKDEFKPRIVDAIPVDKKLVYAVLKKDDTTSIYYGDQKLAKVPSRVTTLFLLPPGYFSEEENILIGTVSGKIYVLDKDGKIKEIGKRTGEVTDFIAYKDRVLDCGYYTGPVDTLNNEVAFRLGCASYRMGIFQDALVVAHDKGVIFPESERMIKTYYPVTDLATDGSLLYYTYNGDIARYPGTKLAEEPYVDVKLALIDRTLYHFSSYNKAILNTLSGTKIVEDIPDIVRLRTFPRKILEDIKV